MLARFGPCAAVKHRPLPPVAGEEPQQFIAQANRTSRTSRSSATPRAPSGRRGRAPHRLAHTARWTVATTARGPRLLHARRRAGIAAAISSPRSPTAKRSASAGVHLGALQHQGGGDALGAAAPCRPAPHRHRGDEPPHAPPDRHRVVRHDDASPDRRAVHARPRSRHRPADRCPRPAPMTTAQLEDFAGLMRRLWPARRWSATTAGRPLSVPALDPTFDDDIPLALTAFGPHRWPRRAGVRPRRAAHVLHRRDARALCRIGEGRRRAGRAVIRHRCRCGRASPRSAITCPSRCA